MYERAKSINPRPRLDKALGGQAFEVDQLACLAAARVLKGFNLGQLDLESHAVAKSILYQISLAAVCHQINWDYLSARLAQVFEQEHITADTLSRVSSRDIALWLKDYHRPERVRATERASLLRNVGVVLIREYGGDAEQLVNASAQRVTGPTGLLARLDAFEAFREDPLRKKSNVLVHEMVRADAARFADESDIQPAIDYHIIRLYLRTGRVVPLHEATRDILRKDSLPRPRLVKLARQSVSEALSLTALYSGMSIPAVNGLEWQIGREICTRNRPKCRKPVPRELLPFLPSQPTCPNASFCPAFSKIDWRQLREPDSKKSFY